MTDLIQQMYHKDSYNFFLHQEVMFYRHLSFFLSVCLFFCLLTFIANRSAIRW